MARAVYHVPLGITLLLWKEDLGHPDIPGLWDIVHAEKYEPGRLFCADPHQGGVACPGRMYLREQPVPGGGVIRQAVHVHEGTPGHIAAQESDKHKALKEHMATAAEQAGLPVDVESRAPSGRTRTDVRITGLGGYILGAEAQISKLTAETVRRRSKIARADGITPLWVTNDPTHQLIHRAPWARIADMPWQTYRTDTELVVRGGVYRIELERCERRAGLCPDRGSGRCGGWHHDFRLATGVYLDSLIVGVAARAMVDVQDGKNVRWVSLADRDRYYNLIGGPPSPAETEKSAETSGDAPTVFDDDPHTLACTYRQNGDVRSPTARPRDTAAPSPIRPRATGSPQVRVSSVLDGTPRAVADIARQSGVNWLGDTIRILSRLAGQGRAHRASDGLWTST
ncbi:MAG: hypothetical protein JWO67_152 [Streptosporangiaceae bacterium]|nr:hypothetical protein [Streptosporangiaceae bacterium]